MTKRVTAALMAALVIMTTTYNAYTVSVYATSIVIDGGILVGDALAEFLATFGISMVGSVIVMPNHKDELVSDFLLYCNTTEGSSALKDYTAQLEVIDGGGSDPEPPEDPEDILDAKIAGLALTKELFDLASGFYNYIMDPANESELGAAINEALNQEITFNNPLGEMFRITSVDDRQHNSAGDHALSSAYPEYDISNSYYIQQVFLSQYTDTILISESMFTSGDLTLSINPVYKFGYPLALEDSSGNRISIDSYKYWFKDGYVRKDTGLDAGIYQLASYVYLCGDFDIYIGDDPPYHLYPDGTLVRIADDAVITPSITTPEGYLKSVKPIVDMDISALVDAIGKAIVEAYPDEAPVLTPEAINQIYNNVSNVYDNAVTNYYNDTSYIDQSQYITNITNVYEQAIADNPSVDIPSIPSAGLGSLNDYKAFGLSNVFPFCIPFDMYHLISVLEADPTAPSFDYTFNFGEYFDEYVYTVDLSVFDPVAKVFRTTQLILYIFGLILITRNMIRG